MASRADKVHSKEERKQKPARIHRRLRQILELLKTGEATERALVLAELHKIRVQSPCSFRLLRRRQHRRLTYHSVL